MKKTDLTKQYKSYYTAKAQPELVEIEKAQFLSLTGQGDPSSPAFADAIQALYATAYALKFQYKSREKDFVVAKLEGLWWYDEQRYQGFGMAEAPRHVPRSAWEYRLLIRMPDFVGEEEVNLAIQQVIAKKQLEWAERIALYSMSEGKVVQMLHLGPFDREAESLQKIQAFIKAHQLQRNGLHHEIYLSDFRKTPPEKLKTILREPVR